MKVPFFAAILLALTTAFAGIAPAVALQPCCAVTAVDIAGKSITIRTNDGKATFELTVADPRQLRAVKVGQAVSLSESSLTLHASGRSATPQIVKLTNVRYVPAAGETPTGATASAASSPFRRDPASRGKCPRIKETPGEQCVLTHDRTSEGKGCEYYCVPISDR